MATTLLETAAMQLGAVLFLSVATILGFVVYRLLATRSARRDEPRVRGVLGRVPSACAGALLGGVLFGAFWITTLAGFHQLRRDGDALVLDYAIPPREVVLARADVSDVLFEPGVRGQSRLVIETRDGRAFTSVPARSALVASLQHELQRTR
jgi:hypothetical protein